MKASVKGKYDRFSKLYDLVEGMIERHLFSSFRKRAAQYISGRSLEVGIGTGKNIPYYPKDIKVVGVDFSVGMLKRAEKRKEELSAGHVILYAAGDTKKYRKKRFRSPGSS